MIDVEALHIPTCSWRERAGEHNAALPARRLFEPVAAGIVDAPEEYAWSSARFHLDGRRSDALVRDADRDLKGLVDDWRTFLHDGIGEFEGEAA